LPLSFRLAKERGIKEKKYILIVKAISLFLVKYLINMKKNLLSAIVLIILSFNSFGQSPDWYWARKFGGTGYEPAQAACTDAAGNIYFTGFFFNDSLSFDGFTIFNNSSFSTAIFLVKLNSSGNVLWAKSYGGADGDEEGLSITTDNSGNVYLTGSFRSTSVDFDTYTVTQSGDGEMFIAKFDPNGNCLWAKSGGVKSGYDAGKGIITDPSDNVIVAVYTVCASGDTVHFGGVHLICAGVWDGFLVKYSSSGNVLWAKGIVGNAYDEVTDVASDIYGNVYAVGYFTSTSITIDTATLYNTNGPPYSDFFIVKYSPAGNLLWAKNAIGDRYDGGTNICADNSGNVYVLGYFQSGVLNFDGTIINNTTLQDTSDLFVIKYNGSGGVLWAKNAGGKDIDYGEDIESDQYNNVYITGQFYSSEIDFNGTILLNSGATDVYVLKYSPTGNEMGAIGIGGIDDDGGIDVMPDLSGNITLMGLFMSPTIFFPPATTLTTEDIDIFVAKTSAVIGLNEYSEENSVIIYPNPSNGDIKVQLPNDAKDIRIYSADGQLVFNKKCFHESRMNLYLSDSGLYFFMISTDSGIISKKIVVINQ
jgi:hypothetical protein